jgi:hypothetical protein
MTTHAVTRVCCCRSVLERPAKPGVAMTMMDNRTALRKGMLKLAGLLLLSSCLFAQGGVEVGSISGAQLRIRTPETWNRTLVLWCDGYAATPRTFQREEKPGSFA